MAIWLDEAGNATSDILDICDSCGQDFAGAYEGLHGGRDANYKRLDYCEKCSERLGLDKCDGCRLIMPAAQVDDHLCP